MEYLRQITVVLQIAAILLLHGYGLASAWHTSRERSPQAATQHCCRDHVCRCTGNPEAARHCCCGMSHHDDADDPAEDDGHHSLRSVPCGDDPDALSSLEKLKYLPIALPAYHACAVLNAFHSRYAMACPCRAIEPQVPPPRPFSA